MRIKHITEKLPPKIPNYYVSLTVILLYLRTFLGTHQESMVSSFSLICLNTTVGSFNINLVPMHNTYKILCNKNAGLQHERLKFIFLNSHANYLTVNKCVQDRGKSFWFKTCLSHIQKIKAVCDSRPHVLFPTQKNQTLLF